MTDAIQKVAAAYDCKIAEGVLSHQLKQFVIDANKVILSVSNPETRVDDAEFEENEVYAIDIVTSTGDGKVFLSVYHSLHWIILHHTSLSRTSKHYAKRPGFCITLLGILPSFNYRYSR